MYVIQKFTKTQNGEVNRMRLLTYIDEKGNLKPALEVERGRVLDIEKASSKKIKSIMELITRMGWYEYALTLLEEKNCIEEISLSQYRAPIYSSDKFLGVALNYRDFCLVGGLEEPKKLKVFGKYQSSLNYDNGAFSINGQNVTYEGELGVVIGKKCRSVKAEDALDYVLGYTIVNDLSANNYIKEDIQLFRGKNLDGAFPFGPVIVTKDEIPDPLKLHITTKVDNEIRQDSDTSNMIFDPFQQIEYFSQFMTLYPGDIIATGTPAGTALQFNPPKFLKRGQVVEITIKEIGSLKTAIK